MRMDHSYNPGAPLRHLMNVPSGQQIGKIVQLSNVIVYSPPLCFLRHGWLVITSYGDLIYLNAIHILNYLKENNLLSIKIFSRSIPARFSLAARYLEEISKDDFTKPLMNENYQKVKQM